MWTDERIDVELRKHADPKQKELVGIITAIVVMRQMRKYMQNKIDYYEGKVANPLEEALGVVGHKFSDEGRCIRCGEDAEEHESGCVEEIISDYLKLLAWAKLVYQTANKAIDNCAFSDKDIEGEFFYHLHGAPEDVKGGAA